MKVGAGLFGHLRGRVLAAIDGGIVARAVAERFRISVSYICKALARRQTTGETEARPRRHQQELKLAAHHEAIAAEVARPPDVALNELRAWLVTSRGVSASQGPIHRTLIRLGLKLKKVCPGAGAEPARHCRPTPRLASRAGRPVPGAARLCGLDGAATNMARHYGRWPRGQCVDGPAPNGHSKSTTFVVGLTNRGFMAPYVLDGAINGPVFRAWIERMLAPVLRPGDVVVMENPAAHKIAGIRQAIEARGAELRYLPPHSPDLNPIEQAFPKLEAVLRKAAERTVDGLWKAIGKLLEPFAPAECANCPPNSGYPRSA
ncbi:MAG: IS630 family transposase [Geminicoccaceae bacterium]